MRCVPIAACAHCETEIVDYSPVIDLPEAIYCCRNCLVASRDGADTNVPDLPVCDHCACGLVEPETLVERHGARYCCYNCAAAAVRTAHVAA